MKPSKSKAPPIGTVSSDPVDASPLAQVQNPAELIEMLRDLHHAVKALVQALESFAQASTKQFSRVAGCVNSSRNSFNADTSHTRDPELLKIDTDKSLAAPVPPESRAHLATLKAWLNKQSSAHCKSSGGSPSNENQ